MDVVIDRLMTKGDVVFLFEMIDCGLGGHTHPTDVVGEKLADGGGHFALGPMIAFALVAELLGFAGAVAGKTLGKGTVAFGRGGAPSIKFIVKCRRRNTKEQGHLSD